MSNGIVSDKFQTYKIESVCILSGVSDHIIDIL
jgi:hypothetical protein